MPDKPQPTGIQEDGTTVIRDDEITIPSDDRRGSNGRKKEAEQQAFLYWLTLTDVERKELGAPRTQVQFAAKYGVSVESLTLWKKRPEFDAAYRALVREKCLYELGGVTHSLVKTAKAGDVAAMKLYLQWLRELQSDGTVVQVAQNVTLQELVKGTENAWEVPTWAKQEAEASGAPEVIDVNPEDVNPEGEAEK